MRFGHRLEVFEDVQSDTMDAMVTTLLLQPLVENAVRHGVSAVSRTCQVKISSAKTNGTLRLAVTDDGPGRSEIPERREGLGLGNVVDRLGFLYADQFHFNAENRPGGGFEVTIELPYRTDTTTDRVAEENE
mgnify:CR=1 FL=1